MTCHSLSFFDQIKIWCPQARLGTEYLVKEVIKTSVCLCIFIRVGLLIFRFFLGLSNLVFYKKKCGLRQAEKLLVHSELSETKELAKRYNQWYTNKKTQEHKVMVDQSTKHRHLTNFVYWCRSLPCVGNYICFEMIYWNVSLGTSWCTPEIQLRLCIWIHWWVLSVVKCTTTPGVWISSHLSHASYHKK